MRKILFSLITIIFISLSAERFIVEFKGELPQKKARGFIKSNAKYKFLVADSDFESLKTEYPDASKIYPEPRLHAMYTPNDTYFSYQWSLNADHYNISYLLDRGVLGSRSVIIGVLDTGISFEDYPIPASEADLVVSSTGNYEMYSDFANINFVQGYDFVSGDTHPNDMNGHGTAVTSVIASSINNALATSGIIMEASIMPLRVLDETGSGNLTDILDAIEYGVSNGCRVLNLSLGGEPGDSNGWDILHSAIIDARNSNVMVLAASGNDGVSMLSYPAGFEEAISVGAVDYYFDRTYYSQYGTNLDFVAPGGVVYQDINGDGDDEGGILAPMPAQTDSGADVNEFYLYFVEGTSFSTPHLSALAGLMYSLGYSTVSEITSLMIDASIDLGSAGYDDEYGWGYPKSESLFSQPVAIKSVDFDVASNILFFSMIILNDTFSLDSLVLSSLLVNEELNYSKSGRIITAEFSAEKSGLYTVTAYGHKDQEEYSFRRDFALRTISDPASVVYHGELQMFSDKPFAVLFDGNKIIQKSDVEIKFVINTENAEKTRIFFNEREAEAKRYEDRIEFYSEKAAVCRIVEYPYSVKTLDDDFDGRSILLSKSSLEIPAGGAMLFDKSGRLIKRVDGESVSFDGFPAGVYFLKSEKMLWKITKLF